MACQISYQTYFFPLANLLFSLSLLLRHHRFSNLLVHFRQLFYPSELLWHVQGIPSGLKSKPLGCFSYLAFARLFLLILV